MIQDNYYSKYLTENDNFFYDEQTAKKSSFLRQDYELFNEDDYVPGKSVRVKKDKSSDDWVVLLDDKEFLILKGSRFTTKEKDFFKTIDGVLFIINGVKSGWKSVSEFKRQIQELKLK